MCEEEAEDEKHYVHLSHRHILIILNLHRNCSLLHLVCYLPNESRERKRKSWLAAFNVYLCIVCAVVECEGSISKAYVQHRICGYFGI